MNLLGQPTIPVFDARKPRKSLTIGLINNMGDQALKATERQFGSLVSEAAGSIKVDFRVFALRGTPRSTRALDYINEKYEPARALFDSNLDGLIVTGTEPRASRLPEEPYWDELVEIIEWAKAHTASTILSCLAAHAAAFHLDAIERRPLPTKCVGIFEFYALRNHPLVGRRGAVRLTPHSRLNALCQDELEGAGYQVLAGSSAQGVDIFTKFFGSQFVFLQGHPEYDADTLSREYRRDLERYLTGETNKSPPAPQGYFSRDAELELQELKISAGDRAVARDLSRIFALAPNVAAWRSAALSFYSNWLNSIAKAARVAPAEDRPGRRVHEVRSAQGAIAEIVASG